MHLPDAFLDVKTVALSTGVAAAGLGMAVKQVQAKIPPRQVPMLGLAAAFIFAAQMVNFPIPGGTSGHLVGGVLTAILLGPAPAVLVMSCVLIVQCLIFADGGLLALGANVFNMGIVSTCGGYFAFVTVKRMFNGTDLRSTVFAAGFAGWFGTVLASITCAGQLAMSGTAAWSLTLPAMAGIHMLIGVGEGAATAVIVLAVLRKRGPGLSQIEHTVVSSSRVRLGFVLAAGLFVFVAPFACPWPDGLERVAEKLGFATTVAASQASAPLADYVWPWVASPSTASMLAGAAGTMMAFAAAYLFARALVPAIRRAKTDEPSRS